MRVYRGLLCAALLLDCIPYGNGRWLKSEGGMVPCRFLTLLSGLPLVMQRCNVGPIKVNYYPILFVIILIMLKAYLIGLKVRVHTNV